MSINRIEIENTINDKREFAQKLRQSALYADRKQSARYELERAETMEREARELEQALKELP